MSWLRAHAIELTLGATLWLSCLWFFQGGGWNQNAHFATTVALTEHGSVALDTYRESTGDLARGHDGHLISAKPIGTALAALPAHLLARALAAGVDNRGNAFILWAWWTSLGTSALALAALCVLLFRLARRHLGRADAALLALGGTLATPLFPNSTMLNSHALVSLFAVAAYALLTTRGPLSGRLLYAAGICAGLPAVFEYMTAVIVVPLGIFALWRSRPRWRIALFIAGVATVVSIPLIHHALVYGDPLKVGYGALVVKRFADDAAVGLFGFVGPSPRRLYELTFGGSRGFFFLSPFLVASLPGFVAWLRDAQHRAEGALAGSIAWGILLLTGSLVYWHSGSALGSRYALLFVPFSTLAVAWVLPKGRAWIRLGMAVGWAFMLVAVSVTAIPPTPPARPPFPNVIAWYWERFGAGKVATYQYHVLVESGVGDGGPTLPFAFNVGQLLGLDGWASLVPYLILLAGALVMLRIVVRARPSTRD